MVAVRIDRAAIESDVRRALAEDIGDGDVTAELLPTAQRAFARVITREQAVLCGIPWFEACFHQLDPLVNIHWHAQEGSRIAADSLLCTIQGSARTLVTAERSALNFLQTLSATATVTATYVEAVQGTGVAILDTRKTLPGLRTAQKYAVCIGGGSNHRMGLYDAVLIKENHIIACGSLTAAVIRARTLHPNIMVEAEVETFTELREALAAKVDRIMLDEFKLDDIRLAVAEVNGRIPLEVSGGVTQENLRTIAETGIDYISIGALTKHVHALDLSMRIELC